MFNEIGRPARHAHRVAASTGVLIAATVAATAVGIAYAFAAPFSGSGSAVRATLASAQSPVTSGTPRLSAAGLDSLLNARFAPALAAVTQQGDTAAQQATTMLAQGAGTLSTDGNVLTLNVPAIANIGNSVQSVLGPVGSQMGQLSGSNGQVASAVNSDVVNINPLLKLTGPNASVSANVPIDLDAAVAPDLTNTTGAGAVTLDPRSGTVTVDLSKLLSGGGTGIQTGTGNVLSPALVAEIGTDINAAASTLGTRVMNSATNSVESTPVNVNANLHLLTQPSEATSGTSFCSSTNPGATSGTTSTSGGLLGGTLGNLLDGTLGNVLGGTAGNVVGGTLDTVDGTVGGILCSLPTNLLPALPTTLSLNLGGNVGQVIEGTAPPASGSISVLGQPTPFNANRISNGVANALVNNFAGTSGNGGSSSGQGSTSSSTGSGGPGNSGLNLTIGANLGIGDGGILGGSGLGGLDLGGLLGSNGTGITPGILRSLLTGGGANLPIGISASVGNGSANESTASGTPSAGSNLLGVNVRTNGNGLTASGTPSAGSNLLGVKAGTNGGGVTATANVGAPASPTSGGSSTGSTGSGIGILGLLRIGTPATGSTNGGQGLLNLGF